MIWLDELEGSGDRGLTPALLAELVRLRVLVIATMSDEAYDASVGGQARARVLVGVEPVELSRAWTKDEQGRLGEAIEDLRLGDVYYWSGGTDTAAFLAVGPELWDEWWRARRPNAHPHGHLLVRVAMDLARCGTDDTAVPSSLLRELCALYEQEAAQAGSRSRTLSRGRPRSGTASPGCWCRVRSPTAGGASPPCTATRCPVRTLPPVPLNLSGFMPWKPSGAIRTCGNSWWIAPRSTWRAAPGGRPGARPPVRGDRTGTVRRGLGSRHSADAGGVEAAGIVGRALADRGRVRPRHHVSGARGGGR
ncbi:hypothetical protein SCYAM73S_05431 [Streptomyces cyaneofuscatus]